MRRLATIAELEMFRQELAGKAKGKKIISITDGTDGRTRGSQEVVKAFVEAIKKAGLESVAQVKSTGCHGFCEMEPEVLILPEAICYVGVKAGDAAEIVEETIAHGNIVERLVYRDPETGVPCPYEGDIPFYRYQERVILGNGRYIDMRSLEDYITIGGYRALSKVLGDMTPETVLAEVKRANLRGRGGGGFPTALKWESTRNAAGDEKYVIVNADEGDPGAYMDRSLLEGNPHSILEGLIIGAYAIGSHQGYVYVRQEYPLAVENLNIAIEQAREYGLIGANILGSGFSFEVKVHRGAGAFVSGESTALIAAIEGTVGEPRPSYTYPSEKGLWDKPTALNNVETWANVVAIIDKGADWYAGIGTAENRGTKIFTLVGKVNNTGLVEVPMGTTLRDIVYKIGGGIPQDKKFKAVQTGGPSGGCIPEQYLDLPVDFDELSKVGSMMGSGGLIVMDEDTCMVDIARYFTRFLSEESCGKCVPCREGLRQMQYILNRITKGRGHMGDLETLEELGAFMKNASLCALGTTAANPVLTTLRHFPDEYEAHIVGNSCPAFVCKELISYYIDADKCQACMICLKVCPVEAISGGKNEVHVIDQEICNRCGTCYEVCPEKFSAVKRVSGVLPGSARNDDGVLQRGK